ncbi:MULTISPECIES: glucose-6-phosphate dehydrogenase [unclassified Salinibacterium]|uniref:glucose-6-phosphate dehydrogenase n=1 Tax=unclassified Salinibacterium TaxID=2632331 RepID=UPI001F0F2772|nr:MULTISPECIES: glucose-6-phosphate dehydrogenase [unclassified Salinibacterium]
MAEPNVAEPSAADATGIRTLIILGATGDLAGRLLLPGLASLVARDRLDALTVVGVGSSDWSDEQWQERVEESFAETAGESDEETRGLLQAIVEDARFHRADVTASGALAEVIAAAETPVAVYFALPPSVTVEACAGLTPADLPEGTRLVLEKPFGHDHGSARTLNRTLAALVPEEQIFRVDHWLAAPTAVNLLGLRFANLVLEPVWNNRYIDRVDIIFDEDLTLEGRAGYYDATGALGDMIQSHLLLVMGLVALEPPASLGERDVRDAIATVLRASEIDSDFASSTRRARYTAGNIEGREVPNYVDEPGVDPERGTETLAEVRVSINNWRWSGVPFILRSGKALAGRRREILVTFKPVPHLPRGFGGRESPTRVRIGLSPETLEIEFDVNSPGDVFTLDRAVLGTKLPESELRPYGQVLEGVFAGDPLLFVRDDAAVECWRIVEPVLDAWGRDEVPLEEYPAGSLGPERWTTT